MQSAHNTIFGWRAALPDKATNKKKAEGTREGARRASTGAVGSVWLRHEHGRRNEIPAVSSGMKTLPDSLV